MFAGLGIFIDVGATPGGDIHTMRTSQVAVPVTQVERYDQSRVALISSSGSDRLKFPTRTRGKAVLEDHTTLALTGPIHMPPDVQRRAVQIHSEFRSPRSIAVLQILIWEFSGVF